jgi:hypothetical protein
LEGSRSTIEPHPRIMGPKLPRGKKGSPIREPIFSELREPPQKNEDTSLGSPDL